MNLFLYGSGVDPRSRERSLLQSSSAKTVKTATLNGYRRCWNVAARYCGNGSSKKAYFEKDRLFEGMVAWLNIVPDSFSVVNGVVVAVSKDELQVFDKREECYARILVEVETVSGAVEAWTFVGTQTARNRFDSAVSDSGAVVVSQRYYELVEQAFESCGQLEVFKSSTDKPSVPLRLLDLQYL